MKLNANLLAALALAAFPCTALAQFADKFDTINPAWITNRYESAGFASAVFDGDSRLRLTIDQTGSTANRPDTASSPFYNTQGRQRVAGITGPWTLSAQVYVSSAFNTTTGPLARSDLWGHTGTTPGGGDYMIFGFTNESPTDTLNPTATDRAFRFRAFDGNTGYWFNLGVPAGFVFDAWHTLSATSTGSTFEFRIDGVLVLTNSTVAGDDLLDAMVQGYNFGQAGSYSIYWDNVTASVPVIPIITNSPLTAAGTVGTPFSFAITATGSPTSFTASPLPVGLSIVAATGAITGTPTAAGTTPVLLSATNATGTDYAALTITVAAAGVAPIIANNPLTAAGTVGTPFGFSIIASGLPTSYATSPLPAGLVCNAATGVITGTPTAVGMTHVLLSATNTTGAGSATLTVTVEAAGVAPLITNITLTAAGTINTPFSFTITASGSPTSYSASPLPTGLVCNATTGVITGIPAAVGITAVLLGAKNATGTGNATLTITVVAAGVAPLITNKPLTAAGTVGTPFGFAITASGSPTSYAASPLPAGLSIVAATGVITGIPTAAGSTSVLLNATNATGTGFAALTITITAAGVAPIITNLPLTDAGTVGTPFGFVIAASGLPTRYAASPLPAGLVCNSATGVITGTPTAVGTTAVQLSATNSTGTGNATLTITVTAAPISPRITTQPLSQTVSTGTTATLIVVASGSPAPTYQWYLDGVLLPGATNATRTIANVQAANAGAYTVTVANTAGTVVSTAATVKIVSSRIVNFSVRAQANSGSQTLTLGCVVSGNNMTLLLRGIGPGLIPFGVANALVDPQLTEFRGSNPIAANDDWQTGSTAAGIPAMTTQVGAFILPNGSKDSALITIVNSGAFTAQIIGANNGTGAAMAEVYDADLDLSARLVNASARMQIDSAGVNASPLILGFVIAGTGPKTVLIRGIGPGLTAFGVTGALADPQILVFSGAAQIASNDNWESGASTSAQISSASAQVGAFALPAGSKDAALLITLQPGSYTVQITGVGNTTGVALIELYDTQ